MFGIRRWHSQLSKTSSFSKTQFGSPKASRMTHSQAFEEERLPWYNADQFYPVHVGETLKSKYRVVGKLGYGAYSTVWLCRDIRESSFVAIKVCIRDEAESPRNDRELKFYEHPPMHMTIHELQRQNPSKRLNKEILNWTLFNLLNALSFLHDEAKVTHTDISPSNVMLTIDDESLLTEFERAELEEPSPTKVIDATRTIYGSRKFGLPKNALWGQPVLCDFGEARIGQSHKGLIQPELYRAPEVLFNMEWESSVDIWNIAVLIWDLFEGRHLFHALDESQESSASHHVAEMVGYLGTPSREYLHRSEVTKNVFNEQGHWKRSGGVNVPDISLEQVETVLSGQEKDCFLAFVRSMLKWLPEERRRAVELLSDPWLEGAIP